MVNDLDTMLRYMRARYGITVIASRPVGDELSLRITREYIEASKELKEKGIEYHEMGSPKRALIHSL